MRDRLRSAAANVITATLGLSVSAAAEVHGSGHDEEPEVPRGIVININPEARVSVTGNGSIYRALSCDKPVDLPVKIVNLGFVTTHIRARLVDSAPAVSSVVLLGNGLTGVREEHRVLRLSLNDIGFVDVTIAFSAEHDIEDLDGRSRVHMLLECRPLLPSG